MTWRERRWALPAAVLEPGRGGIARVARMTARAIAEEGADTRLSALLDRAPHDVAGRAPHACAGRRGGFVLRCLRDALTSDWFLYDAVGPARAHPRLPGLRRPYGLWIHGVEVWDALTPGRERALRGADFVLANSRFTLDRFEARHFALPNAHVCPLATEDDAPPAPQSGKDGPPTALLVGRADRANFRKGHKEAIAAWPRVTARIPDARLLLVGGGDGLDLLRETVAASPARGNIEVLGFVPEDSMPAIWARSHVFVLPGWKEGFGLVYIEAMRHGLPVIASNRDAGAEVNIDGQTGYNVDPADTDALAARIVELLSDRDEAARLGAAGFARWQAQYRYSAFRGRLAGLLDRVAA